ncbi:SDR family oxidoreductase [Lentilactobacillus sp. IMAU92037]|uniref:NAD(P)H-binding protein n=1 Tax=Lentilactobacillus TaxID=2767893 RepID=UPI001C281088|nr:MULTISPECIES: NAD(P)H-binding protein [Lentilactobacillus]MBU9789347.1 SDR family oxidoreductase [Lentilactobacillus dabitei]MBV0930796.1 SDR family oxidoreductase [Lentilactobacillus dabitei]MDM7516807.1 NAD(P)H-binding protein [Lentilactobacillus sp. TOM.63]
MKKLLILNENNPVVPQFEKLLAADPQISYEEYQGNLQDVMGYAKRLKDVDWIFSAVGPLDVDLDFGELFDAIDEVQPPLSHFVMLSYAGVDDELKTVPVYEGVKDSKEFIKQQRYAIKIVDEAEIPYSIIRMTKLTDQAGLNYQLFNEGTTMPYGEVSSGAVAKLSFEMFDNNDFINRSVGIISK